MLKKTIVFLLLIVSILVHAQRSTFIFEPTMFGGVSFGLNNITAEGAYEAYSPFESAGVVGGFHLGLNLSPEIGFKASADFQNFRYPEARAGINSLQFSGVGLSIDAMLNVSNLFSFYNLDRRTDFSVFAGLGTLYCSPSNDETLALMESKMMIPLRLGAQMDYRITRSLDLNVNGVINVLNDSFNEYVIGFGLDLAPKLTVGISYHF
jgi:hypothetical protein